MPSPRGKRVLLCDTQSVESLLTDLNTVTRRKSGTATQNQQLLLYLQILCALPLIMFTQRHQRCNSNTWVPVSQLVFINKKTKEPKACFLLDINVKVLCLLNSLELKVVFICENVSDFSNLLFVGLSGSTSAEAGYCSDSIYD